MKTRRHSLSLTVRDSSRAAAAAAGPSLGSPRLVSGLLFPPTKSTHSPPSSPPAAVYETNDERCLFRWLSQEKRREGSSHLRILDSLSEE